MNSAELLGKRAYEFGLHPVDSIIEYSFSFGIRLQNFIVQLFD
jgi:hypothetical protein